MYLLLLKEKSVFNKNSIHTTRICPDCQMQQNYPPQMSVKKCVICCWPSHPSSIISGGFVWMQTRNTAENSSGPGCHQQPAAQPSPAWGQSKQGEELAAHPTAAWDLLCRIRPLPHLPAHFPNCRSGWVRADTCSCAPSLDHSWLMILLEDQSAPTPAGASREQDALTAASPVGQELRWAMPQRCSTQTYVDSMNYLGADRIISAFPVVWWTC